MKPWLSFYDPGVPYEIEYPEGMLVHHILDQSARRFPNRPATVFPTLVGNSLRETRLSFRDLDHAAGRFANALVALGVQKGDRVALVLPNCPQFLISLFGAWKAGSIVVPLDPRLPAYDLEERLVDCGAETVVTLDRHYPGVKQVQPNTRVTRVIATTMKDYWPAVARTLFEAGADRKESQRVRLDPRDYSFKLMLRNSPEADPAIDILPEDIALLQYTAAGGPHPRASMLTHYSLVSNCLQITAWRTDAAPGHEVVLCVIPLCYLFGLQVGMLSHLLLGSALILLPEFDARQTVLAIDKYQPTVFPGGPGLYGKLLEYPVLDRHHLHSIRVFLSGAKPLPADIRESIEALGARVVEGYGLTEAGPLTHAHPIHGESRPGSVGLPVPGTTARIVDPDNPSDERAPGEVGELAVQGPQLFSGYWNKPDETERVLQDGWLLTGDIGTMDEDGFFYVLARKEDVINTGGFQVYPSQVEEVLVKHPKVEAALVVGVEDPYLGQAPKAFVVIKEGETVLVDELLDYLEQHLAPYQVPRAVEFRSGFQTGFGELRRSRWWQEEKSRQGAQE